MIQGENMRHFTRFSYLFLFLSFLLFSSCSSKKEDSSPASQIDKVAKSEVLNLTGIDRFKAYLTKTVDFMKTDEYQSIKKDEKKKHEKAIGFAMAVGYTGTDKEITKQILKDLKYVRQDKSVETLFKQTITVTRK
jgi:hypothetical protein